MCQGWRAKNGTNLYVVAQRTVYVLLHLVSLTFKLYLSHQYSQPKGRHTYDFLKTGLEAALNLFICLFHTFVSFIHLFFIHLFNLFVLLIHLNYFWLIYLILFIKSTNCFIHSFICFIQCVLVQWLYRLFVKSIGSVTVKLDHHLHCFTFVLTPSPSQLPRSITHSADGRGECDGSWNINESRYNRIKVSPICVYFFISPHIWCSKLV